MPAGQQDIAPPREMLVELTPPPYVSLAPETRACFDSFYTLWPGVSAPLSDYPYSQCESLFFSGTAPSCTRPTIEDLATVRVRDHVVPDEAYTECVLQKLGPEHFGGSSLVYQTEYVKMLQCIQAGVWFLREYPDLIRWACCVMQAWAPQWTGGPPYVFREDGRGVWENTWRAQTGEFAGPADLADQVIAHIGDGQLDVVIVDIDWESAENVHAAFRCRTEQNAGDVIHRRRADALNLPFDFAIILPAQHIIWQERRRAFASGVDELRACAGVRAAVTILHEVVHEIALPWASHVESCLDPAPMVGSAFQFAMATRIPCIANNTCCAWPSDPVNFLRLPVPDDPTAADRDCS